jgi:23S rRNA (cytosine1962-C5)-methyltransferase
MSAIILKRNRAKPVLQRHPWVFSGSIQRMDGTPANGSIVEVYDAGRNWLARGYVNQQSQITVRLLTWQEDEVIDGAFWRRRLERAIAARRMLGLGQKLSSSGLHKVSGPSPTTAFRLVHAESDYLPGLIVDRYDQWLVVQILTLGIDERREEIVDALADLLAPRGIYERSDVDVRKQEGLDHRTGLLWGREPPAQIGISENDGRFVVDVREGHKTGFYLDQRESRQRLSTFCAGADVLDAFAYSGAFAVYAATSGARSITLVDSSAPSLSLARQNLALNSNRDAGTVSGQQQLSVSTPNMEYVEGDVFSVLRNYRARNRRFDIIVLDPPKLAHTRRQVVRASRAYKDINLLAFQLLRPGGLLFTFSCSGRVSADLFQKIVFGALADTDRQAQIIGHLAQGPDHPVALAFPEGAYLKGLICRVW